MPDKLDRCVADVKAEGSADNPWAVCNASINGETKESIIQEKINGNRMVPFFNPDITENKVEPVNQKSVKGIGGDNIDKQSFLWKDIFDNQLKRNVKEPRY